MSQCEVCGYELHIGDWPFCGRGRDHAPSHLVTIGDDIPGGQWIENLDHQPMLFYSKKAIRDEADRRGLRLRDQWAGPHDKYLSNWGAAIDANTLENARILLSRSSAGSQKPPATKLETYKGEIRTVLPGELLPQ